MSFATGLRQGLDSRVDTRRVVARPVSLRSSRTTRKNGDDRAQRVVCVSRWELHHWFMDADGARALAARIAAGPPREDGSSPPPDPKVEVMYLRPVRVFRREVRVFVRRADGRLERSDS
jgi:hypothetical protein